MKTNEEIEKRIEANRDSIQSFLAADLPLDIVYFNIRRLSGLNERLLKSISKATK